MERKYIELLFYFVDSKKGLDSSPCAFTLFSSETEMGNRFVGASQPMNNLVEIRPATPRTTLSQALIKVMVRNQARGLHSSMLAPNYISWH
jgi:hypothetical protein